MGAEVIRFDQIGGGPDFRRWPHAPGTDRSLYWEGLNANKKSIAIDLSHPHGRALAQRLVTAPGSGSGLFLTNYPVDGFLSHQQLADVRGDLITLRVMGQANGLPALDYTVNCMLGIPQITGPQQLGDEPVNHVLPHSLWCPRSGKDVRPARVRRSASPSRTSASPRSPI
jgi:2-methylfumaryl-CoA isomerase